MKNFIGSSIAAKVQIAVQSVFLVVSILQTVYTYNNESEAREKAQEAQVDTIADGVINGANMLMLTGAISDVDQRKLFIQKMGSNEEIKSLRLIRNKLVQKQYGEGLPEERPVGTEELRALEDGKNYFERKGNILHSVMPYTASKNFRGTNCLMCHDVPEGYHNGASVIDLDISADNAYLRTLIMKSIGQIIATQILFLIVINFILHKFVSDPIGKMRTSIVAVSGSKDFTHRVVVGSADEVGQTALAFNELMGSLQNALGQIHDGIERMAASSHSLSLSAHDVAISSSNQSAASSAMAATVEQVTVSVSHVSDGAREAVKRSRDAGTLSDQGSEIILRASDEMRKISNTVRENSKAIESLGAQSTQISSIVKVIEDIADQTNLLALNAAIEAARAGEQGRGFAVVADEVRKLAERTTKATQEVTLMIDTIQTASGSAVEGMTITVKQVEGGVELAQQAGDAIQRIKAESTQVVNTVSDISSALTEQSKASNEMASNIEKIAQMTERNSVTAEATSVEAKHLEELAGDMRATVSCFKI